MHITKTLLTAAVALSLSACGWFHRGPGARDIDAAVRRALDASNNGTVNTLIGRPFPTSADVESVKPDGECVKQSETAYKCPVLMVRRPTKSADAKEVKEADTGLRAELTFEKDRDGDWATTDIDQALAAGAAKSVIDRMNQDQPGSTASSPK
jgi:hypothetical protein